MRARREAIADKNNQACGMQQRRGGCACSFTRGFQDADPDLLSDAHGGHGIPPPRCLIPNTALDACEAEHIALMDCFVSKTIFTSCSKPQQAFWDCYRRERVRAVFKVARFGDARGTDQPLGPCDLGGPGRTR